MSIDALSDVLKALRISGGIPLDAALTTSWGVVSRVGPEHFGKHDELPASVVWISRMQAATEGAVVWSSDLSLGQHSGWE